MASLAYYSKQYVSKNLGTTSLKKLNLMLLENEQNKYFVAPFLLFDKQESVEKFCKKYENLKKLLDEVYDKLNSESNQNDKLLKSFRSVESALLKKQFEKKQKQEVSDELKKLFKQTSLSQYAKRLGLQQPSVYRFVYKNELSTLKYLDCMRLLKYVSEKK